jgi:hypothetical protein
MINIARHFGGDTVDDNHQPLTSHSIFDQDSPLYFPVYEADLRFMGKEDSYPCDTHKAIIRIDDDGNPVQVGLVGKGYKVVKMQDLCHAAEEQLIAAMTDDELKDCKVSESMAYHGGMLFKQYVFPNIHTDLPNSPSGVSFRSIIINAYDGSSSFRFYNGAIDFFCFNGLVMGTFDMVVQRHTSGFSIPKFGDRVRAAIDVFFKQADTFGQWVDKEITDDDAREVYEAIPSVSERRVEQLMRQFRIDCQSHGRTVWALYSAATFYASHNEGTFKVRDTKNDHTAATMMNRERDIFNWTNTDEFKRIAA